MSPEIRIENRIIAIVPDETGMHQTLDGKPLYINVENIDASRDTQPIVLDTEDIGGRRILKLRLDGTGESSDPKRDDKLLPDVSVVLLDRSIRVSTTYKEYHERAYFGDEPHYVRARKTYMNPRWLPNQGKR